MKKSIYPALAVLVGTTIGAGFLGTPYVVAKAGFLPGLACLVFVAAFMLFIKLYLGEIILRTQGNHQLAGYAGRYLGKPGKYLMFFAMLFGIYSALIAYLMGEGQSLSYILTGSTKFSFFFSIFFWLIMSVLTFIGLRALKKYEQIGMIVVFVFVSIILLAFSSNIKIENLSYINSGNIFLPFGVILFSFLAFSAMPEVKRILAGSEKLIKRTIFLGVMIPFFVYFAFMLVVLGNFGRSVPEIATMALGRFFSLLAVLTMFTAFFAQSIAIRDMFRFDFKLGRFRGWVLSCFLPLIFFLVIYFFKLASFVSLLGIAGVVSGGMTGILILVMNKKSKEEGNREPEYSVPLSWITIFLLSLVFVLAVIAQFLL
jgi:tyrosine-specific transport protein